MSLLIEQMTEELGVEKTAEEIAMDKLAGEIIVLDQSRTLLSVGESMAKIASEVEGENPGVLSALALDTYAAGERLGAALVKVAHEGQESHEEGLELAQDMYKIAELYCKLGDESKDETIIKLAEAIIPIANELTEDAEAFYKKADEYEHRPGHEFASHKEVPRKGLKMHNELKHEWSKGEGSAIKKLRHLLTSKEGRHALGKPAAIYGGAAAALAALGYGASKLHKKSE